MKNLQRVSLIFMTSFSALILMLFLWLLFTVNTSWLNTAIKDSHYDVLVYEEIQTEIKQVVPQYGIDENSLDGIITLEHIQENLKLNLNFQEPLILNDEIHGKLEVILEEMDISLTQDVENGIIELTVLIDRIFQDRTRFLFQGEIVNLVNIYNGLRWWVLIGLFGLFGIFCFSLNKQSLINLKIALKASILSYVGVLVTSFILILANKINLSPHSLAQLMTSLINGFLFRGLLLLVLFIGLYVLVFNGKTLLKLVNGKK